MALLGAAEAAHGHYEAEHLGGAYDEQWAQWYARYLEDHGFYAALGVDGLAGYPSLAAWLEVAATDHRVHAPAAPWPDYYARYFPAGRPGTA